MDSADPRKNDRLFFAAYGVVGLGAILFGHRALGWWVGHAAAPRTTLIAGVGAYFCVRSWTGLHTFLLNGLNIIRPQVWSLVATAILTVSIDLLLIKKARTTWLGRWWSNGILLVRSVVPPVSGDQTHSAKNGVFPGTE